MTAFGDAITALGKAEPGDKTMVDALLPFPDTFLAALDVGPPWVTPSPLPLQPPGPPRTATADLRPLKGRARPLAEKSLGHPDPGASRSHSSPHGFLNYMILNLSDSHDARLVSAIGNGAKA